MSKPRSGDTRENVQRDPPAAGARRRREIIDAAATAFDEHGYHGASTQDIADHLGIRQASLYYYFSSKEAALEEVCAVGIGQLLANESELAADTGSSIEKLRRIIAWHLSSMIDRPQFWRVFMTQRRYLTGQARERILRLSRDYERIVTAVVQQGIDDGELRADIDATGMMLTVLGLCNSACLWPGVVKSITVARAIDTITPILLAGCAAGAELRHPGAAAAPTDRARATQVVTAAARI